MSLSVTEAARNFSEYVNRVNYKGDRFLLVKGGRGVAELRPVPKGRRLSELAVLFKSSLRLDSDEIDSFEVDLDAARAEMNDVEVRNPWDS
ncbi:MAG: type II toxin-antitoxin system prevent-host-death family antitoxin [Kiritimatiellia bacterium]